MRALMKMIPENRKEEVLAEAELYLSGSQGEVVNEAMIMKFLKEKIPESQREKLQHIVKLAGRIN